jgi:pyrroloquinoline quinone biosynthesis protein B
MPIEVTEEVWHRRRLDGVGLTATILGSAQDGGLPQAGARHHNDEAARRGAIPSRTASSVAVIPGPGATLLLDASVDLRFQLARSGLTPTGVVLTHAHMGHYAGLLHLGREAWAADRMPVWCTPALARFLSGNAPWRDLVDGGHISVHPVEPGGSFGWEGEEVSLIPVPHRHEHSDTVAVSVGGLLYLPDIDSWDEWPDADATVAGHRTALLDATFWSADELPHRDMALIRHPLVPDTLERFEPLAGDRTLLLTHLNHTNPLCDPAAPEHAIVAASGLFVAEEGMSVPL